MPSRSALPFTTVYVVALYITRQGLSVSAIAQQCDLDRKTVRRYIERGLEPLAYGPRKPRPALL